MSEAVLQQILYPPPLILVVAHYTLELALKTAHSARIVVPCTASYTIGYRDWYQAQICVY